MIEKFQKKAKDLKLHLFAKWALSSLVDGVFLVLWVCVQWLVNQLISNLPLSWIDGWMLLLLQFLFAIATLVPIIAHVGVNVVRHIVHSWNAIQEEMKGVD